MAIFNTNIIIYISMSSYDHVKKSKWLKKYNYNSYKELLSSKNWGDFKKILVLENEKFKYCKVCRSTNPQIHHKRYTQRFFKAFKKFERDFVITKSLIKELMPLCDKCHNSVHTLEWSENVTIKTATKLYLKTNKNLSTVKL